MEDSVADVTIG